MRHLLVTGGNGFLGRAVVEEFRQHCDQIDSLTTFGSKDYDLRDRDQVKALLIDKRPDTIIHLAAVVGGIGANMKEPGRFFFENLIIGSNLIEEARLFGVDKFVLAGTICAYPKHTPVPFQESELWNGYPEETNAPYGIAKKALLVMLEAYRKQYGFNGITLLPVNLYGPGDNFDLESSHVIPAMLRKFHTAKEHSYKAVTLWGDGSPSREFLYVDDAARGVRLATEKYNSHLPVNLGTGKEITMERLAELVKRTVGFEGEIIWDVSKPNGQPRRCLDVSRAQKEFGFSGNISLPMGLEMTYKWFTENFREVDNSAKSIRPQAHR